MDGPVGAKRYSQIFAGKPSARKMVGGRGEIDLGVNERREVPEQPDDVFGGFRAAIPPVSPVPSVLPASPISPVLPASPVLPVRACARAPLLIVAVRSGNGREAVFDAVRQRTPHAAKLGIEVIGFFDGVDAFHGTPFARFGRRSSRCSFRAGIFAGRAWRHRTACRSALAVSNRHGRQGSIWQPAVLFWHRFPCAFLEKQCF